MLQSTSGMNVINLQVFAQDQYEIDAAAGVAEANKAADKKYYLWHGDHQTIPLGMNHDPEGFADAIAKALPGVSTLRIPFNENSFNEDGSLHPEFETFLSRAASHDLKVIFVYMDGDEQRLGADGSMTSEEIAQNLAGESYDRMASSWTSMLDWMDAHGDVADAVSGLEIVNEPASFRRAVDLSDHNSGMHDQMGKLYATQMVSISDLIDERFDGDILVGGWGYSSHFDKLENAEFDGTNALDYIRDNIGEDLVWSAHFYPGWNGTSDAESVDDVMAALDANFAPVADDRVLVTETNAYGPGANDPDTSKPQDFFMSRAYEWFADHGIGISWFPGVSTGASHLVMVRNNGTLEVRHQASLGAAYDGYSLDGDLAMQTEEDGHTIDLDLITARMRNEATDPDYDLYAQLDKVDGYTLGFGGAEDNVITGREDANYFLYGGDGQDTITGSANDDYLYGQDGNDTILSGAGDNILSGGRGDDVIFASGSNDLVTLGKGADSLHADTGGNQIVVDFDPSSGDAMTFDGAYGSYDELRARVSYADADAGSGTRDLVISHDDGTSTTILNGAGLEDSFESWLSLDGTFTDITPIETLDADPGSVDTGTETDPGAVDQPADTPEDSSSSDGTSGAPDAPSSGDAGSDSEDAPVDAGSGSGDVPAGDTPVEDPTPEDGATDAPSDGATQPDAPAEGVEDPGAGSESGADTGADTGGTTPPDENGGSSDPGEIDTSHLPDDILYSDLFENDTPDGFSGGGDDQPASSDGGQTNGSDPADAASQPDTAHDAHAEDPGAQDHGAQAPDMTCFVATASYGNWAHPDVAFLRQFRDEVLLRSPIGRAAIRFYWIVGPRLARRIEGRPARAAVARRAFGVVVRLIRACRAQQP